MGKEEHVKIREEIELLLKNGCSIQKIANMLSIPLGTRFIKGSGKWYRYCVRAKENQRKAIEKHPNLYSKAGKIAKQKYPWLGKELVEKYGKMAGKIRMAQLEKQGIKKEHFSRMAKRLQEINPEHSRVNMKKAHETMRKKGTFNEHQRQAALKCMEKNPNQLKEMSKRAHEMYPLALLALDSRRKNYPYKFMGCSFDSKEEVLVCKELFKNGLMDKPLENVNTHFRLGRFHIDFFIRNKLFLEFHPPRKFGRKIETEESYFLERRKLLDEKGFKNFPLIVISNIKELSSKIEEIKKIIRPL